jgi:hypothetical protein
MHVPQELSALSGEWQGSSRLWLNPAESANESKIMAVMSVLAQGKFFSLAYSWAYEGNQQDGLLLAGFNENQQVVKAAWIDSWHNDAEIMVLRPRENPSGSISLAGSYPAPSGPDWGWWIDLDPQYGNGFKLVMNNVTPEGDMYLAVESVFERIE